MSGFRARLRALEQEIAKLAAARQTCAVCGLPLSPEARAAAFKDRAGLGVRVGFDGEHPAEPSHCPGCGWQKSIDVRIRFDRGEGGPGIDLEPPGDEGVSDE